MKAIFRANRTRSKIHGTAERPRLSVNISNKHVIAKIINVDESKTLAYASTVGSKIKGSMTEKCAFVGTEIAKKAKKAGLSKVVFDRGSKLYAGRMSALAEAARKEGLEF